MASGISGVWAIDIGSNSLKALRLVRVMMVLRFSVLTISNFLRFCPAAVFRMRKRFRY